MASVAAVLVPVALFLVLPMAAVALLRAHTSRRHVRQTQVRVVEVQLPELATLFAIGVRSGLPLVQVCATVQQVALEPFRSAFVRIDARHRHGDPLAEAIQDELGQLSGGADGLASLLRAHVDDGAAVSDALFELAESARQAHRRRAEAEARRLPVRMLVPLIVCVLPAFMALTVAPVIIESLRSLDL